MYCTSSRVEQCGDLRRLITLPVEQTRQRLRLLGELALEVRAHARTGGCRMPEAAVSDARPAPYVAT